MSHNKLVNYGFVEPRIEDDHYVFGALGQSLPRDVLQSDGQWDKWMPTYEAQYNANFDSYGCTVWGTENAIEFLVKKILNLEKNYSERFIYILSNTMPPGNDPHVVAETIRDHGLIEQDDLPFTKTFEEFVQPKPMRSDLLKKGKEWRDRYEFKHEWLFKNSPKNGTRIKLMKEALQYSPLGISVTAWFEENGVYVDRGQPNTHWCICFGWTEKGWKVFDSYDNSVKIVSFDHNIGFCKRYYFRPLAEPRKETAWERFWAAIMSYLNEIWR